MDAAQVFSTNPAISGIRTSLRDIPNFRGPVVHPGQLMLDQFHRSSAYHEFYRPLDLHSGMIGVLREHNELLGALPFWKGQQVKPFSAADVALFSDAVPHIAHGV
jgi:hypothetical protein